MVKHALFVQTRCALSEVFCFELHKLKGWIIVPLNALYF